MGTNGKDVPSETTQSLRRRTVKLVEKTKVHPRESFDEAVARLLEEHELLGRIQREHPSVVATARQASAAT